MDEITTARYQDRLQKRRDVVLRTLRYLEEEQRQVDENDDWLDYAAYNNRVTLLNRLADGYLKETQEIDRALTRIEQKRYGLCVACYNPIERRRLETLPEVDYCVVCKELREEFAEV